MGSLFARSHSFLRTRPQHKRILSYPASIQRTFRTLRTFGTATMTEPTSKPVFFFDIDNCVRSSRDLASRTTANLPSFIPRVGNLVPVAH